LAFSNHAVRGESSRLEMLLASDRPMRNSIDR